MRYRRAMPRSTAADRRRSVGCPKCGAEPNERCRKRIPERYTTESEGTVQGEGRWLYLTGLHVERRDPKPESRRSR